MKNTDHQGHPLPAPALPNPNAAAHHAHAKRLKPTTIAAELRAKLTPDQAHAVGIYIDSTPQTHTIIP